MKLSETDKLEARIQDLEIENRLLRGTIEHQKRQMKHSGTAADTIRRLRAKIAEWEGNSQLFGNGYHHGALFIQRYIDNQED